MSAFKQLLASDVIVSPFEVNKGFSFNLSQFGEDNVQINRLWGRNVDYLINPSLTGDVNVGRESKALVYNSIKELYCLSTAPYPGFAARIWVFERKYAKPSDWWFVFKKYY